MGLTLVLGGVRSGKTRHALGLAAGHARVGDRRLVMIATAEALDDEMRERIAHHQAERGDAWATIEAPLALAAAVAALGPGDVAVIDCLTLWISNLMLADRDVVAAVGDLATVVAASPARIVLVSNEVGWGVVPDNALARRFRDEVGRAHQGLAHNAEKVVLVVAGLPLTLKGPPASEP